MHTHKGTTDPTHSDLLTLEQIATLCGCSVRAIEFYRKRGEFPTPLRVGPRMVRWPRAAIDKWLAR